MTKQITVASVQSKTAGNGTPYLFVKDTFGNSYSVWEQIIFHLFAENRTLTVEIVPKGKYNNITMVLGQNNPQAVAAIAAQPASVGAAPTSPTDMWGKLWKRMDNTDAMITKIGKLVAAQSGLPSLDEPPVGHQAPQVPNDVVIVPDDEIKPEDIPF